VSESLASVEEAHRWLAKADDDLIVATVIVAKEVGVNWAACFHAQQATEKALKALLVVYGIDFPRSHALERLLALLPASAAIEFDSDAVGELSPWAVAGRYPEDIPNPDSPTTQRLLDSARAAVDRSCPTDRSARQSVWVRLEASQGSIRGLPNSLTPPRLPDQRALAGS
jgi:HEPN domain-containing protein